MTIQTNTIKGNEADNNHIVAEMLKMEIRMAQEKRQSKNILSEVIEWL
jgi:hypothetical protein